MFSRRAVSYALLFHQLRIRSQPLVDRDAFCQAGNAVVGIGDDEHRGLEMAGSDLPRSVVVRMRLERPVVGQSLDPELAAKYRAVLFHGAENRCSNRRRSHLFRSTASHVGELHRNESDALVPRRAWRLLTKTELMVLREPGSGSSTSSGSKGGDASSCRSPLKTAANTLARFGQLTLPKKN